MIDVNKILVIYDFVQKTIVPLAPAIAAMPRTFQVVDTPTSPGGPGDSVAD